LLIAGQLFGSLAYREAPIVIGRILMPHTLGVDDGDRINFGGRPKLPGLDQLLASLAQRVEVGSGDVSDRNLGF
jgi:hypothetical protein